MPARITAGGWDPDAYKDRVKKSSDRAIGRAAIFAGALIRNSMPGAGASRTDSQGRTDGQADTIVPSTPGNPPGVRSGDLVGSINSSEINDGRWKVGTNTPYAAAHELGATIAHPGGTAYFVTKDGARFISNAKATQLEAKKIKIFRTKPHTITLPARPFFFSTIRTQKQDIVREYMRIFRAEMLKGV